MSKARTNPRKKPVTEADLKRAKHAVMQEAVQYAFAVVFTVLADKHGYDVEQMAQVWRETEDLSLAIKEGFVRIADLKHTLKTEYGVNLVMTGEDDASRRRNDDALESEAAGLLIDATS